MIGREGAKPAAAWQERASSGRLAFEGERESPAGAKLQRDQGMAFSRREGRISTTRPTLGNRCRLQRAAQRDDNPRRAPRWGKDRHSRREGSSSGFVEAPGENSGTP